ncbi:MAG: FIST C-terminal domain-containing protein [Verrucomicrobia bacterium]|nr:FIST C-terminal domain-containing protein [Verrucomicrobiota bacterium]
MQNKFAVAAHWNGGFDEARLKSWAVDLRASLAAPSVTLGLVFVTPALFERAREVLEVLRVHAQIPLLAGCSSTGLVVNGREIEDASGLALALYHLPGAELKPFRFTQEQVEEANGPAYWHDETSLNTEQSSGWLAFADPFTFDAESWVKGWNAAYPAQPLLGGIASGDPSARSTQLYLNGDIFEDGAVAIAVSGAVKLASVISQGCEPIGQTGVVTKADRNFIHEIGSRPAYAALVEAFNSLPAGAQAESRGRLHVGLVINEYLEEFHRGDFLIRNLLGADPAGGSIAIGATPRLGQTVQFQRRDAQAATEDMAALLARAKTQLAGKLIYGGVLCCCNGRGTHLFGAPDHDAGMVQRDLGPLALTGFFCNGELGPIGERNFVHGYTASLGLFVKA